MHVNLKKEKSDARDWSAPSLTATFSRVYLDNGFDLSWTVTNPNIRSHFIRLL